MVAGRHHTVRRCDWPEPYKAPKLVPPRRQLGGQSGAADGAVAGLELREGATRIPHWA